MRQFAIFALIGLGVSSVAIAADEPKSMSYVPGLGEFMTGVQMHHAKLWFAGTAANWKLADFELDEIKETFDDASRLYPTDKGIPVGAMIKQNIDPAIDALTKAIAAKNVGEFRHSYDRLTAACNTCHAGAQHEFIQIKRPTTSPATNQVYVPAHH